MKNKTAPGPDGLNYELFKYGGPVLSNRLLKLSVGEKIDSRGVGTSKRKIPI
jgi:hypothetical protein